MNGRALSIFLFLRLATVIFAIKVAISYARCLNSCVLCTFLDNASRSSLQFVDPHEWRDLALRFFAG
jgi:hypothetical protein